MPSVEDRITGGLIGLLVGDALGVPYEFHLRSEIPPHGSIEFTPPVDFERAHPGIEPGTWSDDGAQALCLLASLLDRNRFNARDFSTRLINWYEHGYMAVDGRVFDVGIQTAQAISRLRSGIPHLKPEVPQTKAKAMVRSCAFFRWHCGTRGRTRNLYKMPMINRALLMDI